MLLVSDAIGQPLPGSSELAFAVWRGEEESASAFIEATLRERTELGSARLASSAASLGARLYNSLGRHGRARDLALRAFESDELAFGPFLIPELAEAASRTGDSPLLERTLAWVAERARFTPTEWCLGIEARVSALLESGEAIDKLHRESIEHLGRTRVRIEVARGHLVYGEWLREENRRSDAREQLKTAHELFTSLGASFLADRAARALLATGGTVRTPSVDSATDLTAQEAQVACLARDGLSNPEIGARLFISARTVQYHLRKVFQKLDITSRGELHRVLAND